MDYDLFMKWIAGLVPGSEGRSNDKTETLKEKRLKERRSTAAHEAGHVITAWFSPFRHVVSARASGQKGGTVETTGWQEYPAFEWDQMVGTLAGIAAELLVVKSFSGKRCANDLLSAKESATRLLENSENPESAMLWTFEEGAPAPDFSKIFRSSLPPRVSRLMTIGYWRAREVIRSKWPMFMRLTEELDKRETLSEFDLTDILGDPVILDTKSIKRILTMSG
jgi:ATP-dependent Zn protease